MSPSGQFRFAMAISAAKWTHQPKDALKNPPGSFLHIIKVVDFSVYSIWIYSSIRNGVSFQKILISLIMLLI
jgi:hypothetical protein